MKPEGNFKIEYRLTGEDASDQYSDYEYFAKCLFEKGKIKKASPALAARYIVKHCWKLYISGLYLPSGKDSAWVNGKLVLVLDDSKGDEFVDYL